MLWQFQARRHHFLLVVGVGWGQDLNFHCVDQLFSPRRQVGFLLKLRHLPERNFPLPFCNLLSECFGPLRVGLEGAAFPDGHLDRTGRVFSGALHLN